MEENVEAKTAIQVTDQVRPLSDLQWYFARSRNPVYFALHVPRSMSQPEFESLVTHAVNAHPILAATYDPKHERLLNRPCNAVVSECRYENVDNIAKSWSDSMELLPQLARRISPSVFRAYCFASRKESLVLFTALHAVIEGMDIPAILRGSPTKTLKRVEPMLVRGVRSSFYFLAATGALALHHLASRLTFASDQSVLRHFFVARSDIKRAAREMGVSNRALLSAIGDLYLRPNAFLPPLVGFTEYERRAGVGDDDAVKLRLRVTLLRPAKSIAERAQRFHAAYQRSAKRPFIFQRINTIAVHLHRRLSQHLPWLYPDRIFDYLPFSHAYTLLPPNRFNGPLKHLKDATLYSGSLPKGCRLATFCSNGREFMIAFKSSSVDADALNVWRRQVEQLDIAVRSSPLE